jgi:hypothetical protein
VSPTRNRRRKWLIRLALVVASFAGVELGLRALLLGDFAQDWSIARKLRRPELYADQQRDDLYWLLQSHFLPSDKRGPANHPDPELGWTSELIAPRTYAHPEHDRLRDRRPVLLYGDSYASCNTEPDDCFQGLLERSGFATQLCMLNYGVGGYGFDQIWLLMHKTLDLYANEHPLVIVSLLVDDDLDRSILSFRCWPKPRFELAGGELELHPPLPMAEYWRREHWLLTTSLVARLFTHRLLPRSLADGIEGVADIEQRKQALSRALLEAVLGELERRRLDHLVVLFFNSRPVFEPELTGWREPLIREVLERHGTPTVDTRGVMLTDSGGDRGKVAALYGGSPKLEGHFNPGGNAVAFRAFEWAFEHYFGIHPRPTLDLGHIARKVTPGPLSAAACQHGAWAPFTDPADDPRLCIRVGAGGPTEVEYDLGKSFDTLRALARFVPAPNAQGGSVNLSISLDDERVYTHAMQRADPPLAIEVALTGRSRLKISVDDAGDGVKGDFIVISRVRTE